MKPTELEIKLAKVMFAAAQDRFEHHYEWIKQFEDNHKRFFRMAHRAIRWVERNGWTRKP